MLPTNYFIYKSYVCMYVCMYKQDLALDNQQE